MRKGPHSAKNWQVISTIHEWEEPTAGGGNGSVDPINEDWPARSQLKQLFVEHPVATADWKRPETGQILGTAAGGTKLISRHYQLPRGLFRRSINDLRAYKLLTAK